MSNQHHRPSSSKISAARKEEIASLLEVLGLDSSGFKSKLEPRLFNALQASPELINNERFSPYYTVSRSERSTSSTAASANTSRVGTETGTGERSFIFEQENPFVAKTIKQESPEIEKDTQFDENEDEDDNQVGDNDDDDDNSDDDDDDDDEEHETSILNKSMSIAMEKLEEVDEKARKVSKRWNRIFKKRSKKAVKKLSLVWSDFTEFLSSVRTSVSKLSVANGLFLLIELIFLVLPLVYQHWNNAHNKTEIIKQDFESEVVEDDFTIIKSSSSIVSYPVFTSVSAFFTTLPVSNFNPVFCWFIFFFLAPLLTGYFFNLSLNYYTKKQQEFHHQLSLENREKQSVAKRTRSHNNNSYSNNNNILAEFDDEDSAESKDDFKPVINSPFIVDPLVFALARFALVYLFYSFAAPSSSVSVASTFITVSSHAIKSALGNLPYLHSIFSALIALYIVSL